MSFSCIGFAIYSIGIPQIIGVSNNYYIELYHLFISGYRIISASMTIFNLIIFIIGIYFLGQYPLPSI